MTIQAITPCLWFDGKAEEAVNFYLSVFKEGKILQVDRYSHEGPGPGAPVIFIEFELHGRPFQAINGGPEYSFSEAISFSIDCTDQAEVDYYWERLTEGGEPGPCGWLKDKYGVSWQVVPRRLNELLRHPDRARAGKALRRMLEMGKLDVAELQAAFDQ